MSTPFPGVDPYLEAQGSWPDFHATFINAWREALLDRLPTDYDARLDEHVYIVHDHVEPGKLIIPDVAVEETPDFDSTQSRQPELAVETEQEVVTTTMTIPLSYEARESYIKIQKFPERNLVAVLELLSPTNKGRERDVYMNKRDAVLASTVHLVELDFLLGGRGMPPCDDKRPGHYLAILARGDQRRHCVVKSWNIRNRLPKLPIPLAGPGEQVVIDLNDVFRTAWRRGRYERAIDYSRRPELPLADEDLTWVRERAAAQQAGPPV